MQNKENGENKNNYDLAFALRIKRFEVLRLKIAHRDKWFFSNGQQRVTIVQHSQEENFLINV